MSTSSIKSTNRGSPNQEQTPCPRQAPCVTAVSHLTQPLAEEPDEPRPAPPGSGCQTKGLWRSCHYACLHCTVCGFADRPRTPSPAAQCTNTGKKLHTFSHPHAAKTQTPSAQYLSKLQFLFLPTCKHSGTSNTASAKGLSKYPFDSSTVLRCFPSNPTREMVRSVESAQYSRRRGVSGTHFHMRFVIQLSVTCTICNNYFSNN